jgi:hypothetical protein
MSGTVYKVKVTQVKVSLPFVKVFARKITDESRKLLSELRRIYNESTPVEISIGKQYIGKISPVQYERCQAKEINKETNTAKLFFIDCGYEAEMHVSQVDCLTFKCTLKTISKNATFFSSS